VSGAGVEGGEKCLPGWCYGDVKFLNNLAGRDISIVRSCDGHIRTPYLGRQDLPTVAGRQRPWAYARTSNLGRKEMSSLGKLVECLEVEAIVIGAEMGQRDCFSPCSWWMRLAEDTKLGMVRDPSKRKSQKWLLAESDQGPRCRKGRGHRTARVPCERPGP
jgi:hypothetical protein